MMLIARYGVTWLMACCISACTYIPVNMNPHADAPLTPISLDLPRYMGRWYVIASIPMFDERDYVGSAALWTLRDDGDIDDAVIGRKHGFDQPETRSVFRAHPEHGAKNSVWKVRPLWPFEFIVMTVYLDPDYQYTVRVTPDKAFAWILSRRPDMPVETYQAILLKLDDMGFDTSRFRRVAQLPEPAGSAGSPGSDVVR
ncbi:lipocalin family protein [Caballeronia sp. BR00000012568055]|uniref:lipocalin family protein n=1 Tax=Caballeronia sp. BR00000012568055 TaxID=2918761 RepID=UPI0023F93469|nr:lipocalin family protein [Caballeronia sp. BR00000012568055]